MTPRRLPVYLLLDCSGSMSGEPIEAVRTGVKALLNDLKGDPQALETAYLSVITFDSNARQVVPLTEVLSFQEPNLEATGTTAFGGALKILEQCLDTEVKKSTPEQKGDWKPLVFVMTDGQPTDSWEDAADRLKTKRVGNIIACAAGSQADTTILKRLTENVVKLDSLTPEALRTYFKWVSSSISATGQSLHQVGQNAPVNLPPPPATLQIVP
jgi:uncharacterized protein YegL